MIEIWPLKGGDRVQSCVGVRAVVACDFSARNIVLSLTCTCCTVLAGVGWCMPYFGDSWALVNEILVAQKYQLSVKLCSGLCQATDSVAFSWLFITLRFFP